jgi:AhpC/TSA antioxidant enzyme
MKMREYFVARLLPVVLFTFVCLVDLNLQTVHAFAPLMGVKVVPVTSESSSVTPVDIGKWLSSDIEPHQRSLLIFGTHPSDLNAIEYGQRIRYYLPILRETKNITKCAMILNCQADAARAFSRYVDLPAKDMEVWIDPTGAAGRAFGVNRGWLPENRDLHPYLKLTGMLIGLGAWASLPAVISGYIGNPWAAQPWITDAFLVGNRQKRWPMNALEMAEDGVTLVRNTFELLPLFGSWGRRPLELATLRLQSIVGISLAHWDELGPDEEALASGVLTQLGGCLILEGGSQVLYEWKDPGLCAVANFEDILKKI